MCWLNELLSRKQCLKKYSAMVWNKCKTYLIKTVKRYKYSVFVWFFFICKFKEKKKGNKRPEMLFTNVGGKKNAEMLLSPLGLNSLIMKNHSLV